MFDFKINAVTSQHIHPIQNEKYTDGQQSCKVEKNLLSLDMWKATHKIDMATKTLKLVQSLKMSD